jgi:acylphosphatase
MDQEPDGAQPWVEAHVVVRGRVQGVSYRWSLQREASTAGLHGWVRNLADGSVEAVVRGPGHDVERLLDWIRRGPPGARVESVDVAWRDAMETTPGFEIRP